MSAIPKIYESDYGESNEQLHEEGHGGIEPAEKK